MSGLFIALYASRRGRHGQSLVIAVAKWTGTLAPTFLFGVIEDAPFILGLGVMCAVFDLAYVALLARDPAAGREPAADREPAAGGPVRSPAGPSR